MSTVESFHVQYEAIYKREKDIEVKKWGQMNGKDLSNSEF